MRMGIQCLFSLLLECSLVIAFRFYWSLEGVSILSSRTYLIESRRLLLPSATDGRNIAPAAREIWPAAGKILWLPTQEMSGSGGVGRQSGNSACQHLNISWKAQEKTSYSSECDAHSTLKCDVSHLRVNTVLTWGARLTLLACSGGQDAWRPSSLKKPTCTLIFQFLFFLEVDIAE